MMAVFKVVVATLRSTYQRLRPRELHLFYLRISAYALPLGVALFVLISIPLYYVLLPSLRTNVVFPTVALSATNLPATNLPAVRLSEAFPRLIREISTNGSGGNAYVDVFASVFDTGGIPSVGSPNMLMLGVLQSVARDGGGDVARGNVRVFLLGNTSSKRLNRGNFATLKKLRRSGIEVAIVPEASILSGYSEPRRGEVSQCLHDGVFVVVIREGNTGNDGAGVAYVVHAKITPYMYGESEERTALGFQTGIQGGVNLQRGVEIYLGLC